MSETFDGTKTSRLRQILLFLLAPTLVIIAQAALVRGQTVPAPTPSPTASPTASPAAPASPTPIPLAEVVTQAETVSGSLRKIETELATDQITTTIERELPVLMGEIDARRVDDERILNSRPSLDTLKNLEAEWQILADKLNSWKVDLTTRATALAREITRLTEMEQTWSTTLAQAESNQTTASATQQTTEPATGGANTTTPLEIIQRMTTVIAAIKQTRSSVEARRAQVLTLQNRVAEQDARIANALVSIRQKRQETINRLFVKDSPPIWSAEVRSRAGENLLHDSQNSFATQWAALTYYSRRQWQRFVLHAVILVLLVAALYWARRRVQPWVVAEPSLEAVARVFKIPIATGFVLSILLSGWLYPQAPRLLTAILGAAALIPTIVILRQLVERHLFAILNALVVFYLIDLVRGVTASLPVLTRLLFLAEVLGGLIFLAWLVRSARLSQVAKHVDKRHLTTISMGARIAGLVFLATFIANALGYVSIASLVGNALLSSAYIAVVFYVAVRIADGLIMFASRVRPLRLLGMVHRHRSMLRRRIRRVLQWLAIIGWFVLTLDSLSLRGPVIDRVRAILTADLPIGALSVSLGDVLVFALTVWAAFLLSRFIRFLLEEDVYPRAGLARGVPYAISTMLHYVILLVGFFVAIAAMGFDMTKFTILAGAFGVGLGFGMQNIVNNFVSGLILLFERPVKVGDVIQLEDTGGAVESIGIRASLIRTWDSSEIIVPNSKLISERVTNWTYSSRQRGIEIIVGVEYGTNSRRVIELLLEIGEAHPSVTDAPPPQAFFTDFGADSINFALRAWTDDFQEWQQMRSDLVVAIYEKFNAEGITIPNTQRDLHLRSIDPEAVKVIKSYSTSEDRSNDEDHAIEDAAPAQNKASGTKK